MIGKTILLISPEAWGKSKVSKHHYALELAKRGNKVYFLNPNTTSFNVYQVSDLLHIIDYEELLRGGAFFPRFIQAIYFKFLTQYLERKLETRFDIIWNFDSSRFYELSTLPRILKICHIVDMAENLNRHQLAKSSTICFCTSDYILRELKKSNSCSYKIHHGFQFPELMNIDWVEKSKGKINVGFVGNLARGCIDWELVFKLLDYNNCHFHFVGNYNKGSLSNSELESNVLNDLLNRTNVTLYGERESKEVPSFLKRMDILIIPYSVNTPSQVAQHSNLHKTMEYLGSGKTIVSCYQGEYKDKRHLLEMVDEIDTFPSIFKKVVGNIGGYNSEEKQKERTRFAMQHTYNKQLGRIKEYLKKHDALETKKNK